MLTLLLGRERRQRLALERGLVAATVYVISMAYQWYAVAMGHSAKEPAYWISGFIGVGLVAFYAAIRSGWSARFTDPSLGQPQMLFASVCLAWAYAHNPLMRGCYLMVVALVIVFGAYTVSAKQIRMTTLFALLVFGGTMGWESAVDPLAYPRAIELQNFLFFMAVLPAFAYIAGQLSALRARARSQKAELRAALTRIMELATHDELTGLFNRRYLQRLLEEREQATVADATSCAVVIVDLDHFKSINDRFGHAMGDEVLREVATAFRAHVRDTDVVGRWGGEEFLVVLPGVSERDACAAIERVRKGLERTRVLPSELGIRFSAGVTAHRIGEPMKATIERADRALYACKERGRNMTLIAPQQQLVA